MQVMQNFSIEHFIPIQGVWDKELIQDIWWFLETFCTLNLCMIFICDIFWNIKVGKRKGIIGISVNFTCAIFHALYLSIPPLFIEIVYYSLLEI